MFPNVVDLPESARVDSFLSPAFRTTPPELRNGELMSDDMRRLYDLLWNQDQPVEEIVCSVVLDAIVEGPGLVFDRDFNLIRQTIHQTTPGEIESAYASVRHFDTLEAIPYERGVTLLCEKAGLSNYGHWLIEMLPIAYLNLHQLTAPGGWRLRMPVASTAMNDVFRDSLDLLGVPLGQIDRRKPGPQRYEQLVIVRGLTHHGFRYSPLVIGCMDKLSQGIPAEGEADIWVSRAGLRRSFMYEHDLCSILAANGWAIVEPGAMTLRQQIGMFKGARRIAGMNGAGLTNLVFAPPGITVTSFVPVRMPDIFFWMLSGHKGQRFIDIRCPQMMSEKGPQDFDTAVIMSNAEVLRHLG